MLLRFRVSNFLSFDKTQEFSMIAGKPRLKLSHVYQDNGINTLKFAAVYGANASGKSNLIHAIESAQKIITQGLDSSLKNTYCKIQEENNDRSTTFEFDIKVNEKYYSYGVSALLSARQITEEWLYEVAADENAESILLYSREYNEEKKTYTTNFDTRFPHDVLTVLNAYVDGNSEDTTFLSIFSRKKSGLCERYPILSTLFAINDWFNSTLTVIRPQSNGLDCIIQGNKSKLSIQMFSVEELGEFLRVLGLGINDLRISDMSREELKKEAFLTLELSRLTDSLPIATAKDTYQQQLTLLKAEIKEKKLHLEDFRKRLDKLTERLNSHYPENIPTLDELKTELEKLDNEFFNLKTQEEQLIAPAADAAEAEKHDFNLKYASIITEKEKIKKSQQKVRGAIFDITHRDDISKELIPDIENDLKEMADKEKSLLQKMNAVSSPKAEYTSEPFAGKSYLIINSNLLSCNIILFTPNGNEEEPKIQKIEFGHGRNNIYFGLSEESDGTQRMIELLEILWAAKYGSKRVFIVDEVDRSLHPDLTRKLVETFLQYLGKDSETQLIVTTHESRIMDLNLLRQDEIWFVDKNADGISSLYSLEEYDERYDRKIDKAYFEGRYGAIPMFNVYFPCDFAKKTKEE